MELTPRQLEVLKWTALGKTEQETADIMGISKQAVCHHKLRVRDKLDAPTIAAMTHWAIAHGVVELMYEKGKAVKGNQP